MSWADRLGEQRAAFDAGFADAAAAQPEAPVRLVGVRAGGEELAFRLDELRGLHRGRRIVPLPGAAPSCLGVAGVRGLRGRVVAVFSLAGLLGLGGDGEAGWLAVCGDEGEPVALAFAALAGYHLVPPAGVHAAESGRPHLSHVARVGETAVPVVSVTSLVAALRREGAGWRLSGR